MISPNNAFDAGDFPTLHSSVSSTLTHLDLSDTNRTGTFPTLSSYSELAYLDLSPQQFRCERAPPPVHNSVCQHADPMSISATPTETVGIPSTIGYLTSLTTLNLSTNQLTGSIPTLSALTDLTELRLSDNNFHRRPPSPPGSGA